ncbi:hypothetical protein [Pseudoduganella sp. GCM10020061]|uniref:hypothetical protein n=1 Tax=Pseudoduganella sp. GCM10020061 TaxID=3317345 RepID=UPI0036342F1F
MSDKSDQVQQFVIKLEPRERLLLSVTLVCATVFFALAIGERIGVLLHQVLN